MTRVWAKRGTRPRAPRDQRYKRAYTFGAVCPARRTTAALVMPFATTAALNSHLVEISKDYEPELNPVENIWAYLRANKLAITVFDSYEHIVDTCCEA